MSERDQYERLRALAHEAPMNIYHVNHDGHRWIEIVSVAWAQRSRDLMRYREQQTPAPSQEGTK